MSSALVAGSRPAGAVPALQVDSTGIAGLPLIELPVAQPSGPTMAVILSGDGGWAAGDKQMAAALTERGIPVVGFDTPSYLTVKRSPDLAASDLERLLSHYLVAWNKREVLLIGYSHGADIAPFMVSRLTSAVRSRIGLLTLVGLSSHTSFQFHVADMVADISHPDDVAVLPELEKLRGMRLLCVQGTAEKNSLCSSLDPSLARVETHAGGHRVSGSEGRAVVDLIFSARQRGL